MSIEELEAGVDAYVEEVWPNVVADIKELVSYASIANAEPAEEGAPFGRPVRQALDCALGIAQKLGYQTSDDDGYVGMADIAGETDAQIATIAHCDVVPAGPGWNSDPFAMEEREGWLVGRGVIDDKGPAVLSLYAGAYLLKHGVKPRHSFRALLGCDEEVGMSDIHHYLDGHDAPAFLFTPDAEFPVCNAEKGQFGCYFKSPSIVRGRIVSWSGAEAPNAIPSQSICELAVDASELPEPAAHADRITLEAVGQGQTRITAQGIGGHASMPEGSINAIDLMVDYLREAERAYAGKDGYLFADPEHDFLKFLKFVTADSYGKSLGIASESEAFGPLTSNAGCIALEGDRISVSLDVRFPDSTSSEEITTQLLPLLGRFDVAMDMAADKPPFSVSADSPAVQTLIGTYNEVMGKDAKPFSMGGGTYARCFPAAVSFGPEETDTVLPSWGGTMHGPNEVANVALLKKALKIYILAILRLDQLDL